MVHIVLAVLLLGHAVADLPGFPVFRRIATLKGLPYRTTILAGSLHVGDAGIGVFDTLWLIAALAFVVCSTAARVRTSWWFPATVTTAAFSRVICILGWSDTRIGALLNTVVLVVLLVGLRTGKLL